MSHIKGPQLHQALTIIPLESLFPACPSLDLHLEENQVKVPSQSQSNPPWETNFSKLSVQAGDAGLGCLGSATQASPLLHPGQE